MNKKFSVIFILLAFIMTIGVFGGFKAKVNAIEYGENIQSKSAYLMDYNTKTVIYAKNELERRPIASMCKIMTLLLTFEEVKNGNLKLEDSIVVSENANGMGGSQIFLDANAEYQVGELVKGVIVASANDASVALAERICGSENAFVEKMNLKASQLGMENTKFSNCTGLPKPEQYSCAKDVAIMFSELIKHKEYFKYSTLWMDEICHPNDRVTEISNTNKLIRFYEGCDGGKTGYTSEAGHCLTACARRNGMRLISVIISAPDSKTRFKEASNLFNFGFANYCNKIVLDEEKPLENTVKIKGGKADCVGVKTQRTVFVFSEKNQKRSVEIVFKDFGILKAPIYQGDVIGEIIVYENGKEIAKVPAVATEDVLKASFGDAINNIAGAW